MTTFDDAVDRAQLTYPNMTQNQGLEFAIEIYEGLLLDSESGRSTQDINVTDGTAVYSIAVGTRRIDHAEFVTEAGQSKELMQVSPEQMEAIVPGYRTKTITGTPGYFITEHNDDSGDPKAEVRLYPPPDTTTSSGYPILRLHTGLKPTISGSTVLPEQLADRDVFPDGIKYKYAKIYKPEDAPGWLAMYELSKRRALESLNRFAKKEDQAVVHVAIANTPSVV